MPSSVHRAASRSRCCASRTWAVGASPASRSGRTRSWPACRRTLPSRAARPGSPSLRNICISTSTSTASKPQERVTDMLDKPWNNRAWFFVIPVLVFVLFSSIVPMMTVVHYSVQDSMGQNSFFWNGLAWFQNLLDPSTDIGGRFAGALVRNLIYSLVVLAIELPLGIMAAICIPRHGWKVGATLVLIALPLLIPYTVVGTIWQIFARQDIGLLGAVLNRLHIPYNDTQD